MTKCAILEINGILVRYDGEGLERQWFTILRRGFETTFAFRNCRRGKITDRFRSSVLLLLICAFIKPGATTSTC
jgi:hypothetical protein